MAQVTGLTADRMLAIEAASVVDGDVNTSGHLILTKHDGTTLDAGDVRGPQGPPGIQGVQGIQGPIGPSAPQATAATPSTLVLRDSAGRAQMVAPSASSDIATKGYVDSQDLLVTELGGGVDLNTIVTPGKYWQSQDAEATSGTNYPSTMAGLLEVFANFDSTEILQRYSNYNPDYTGGTYIRRRYQGTWYAWRQTFGDSPWQTPTLSSPLAVAGGLAPRYKRMNNVLYMDGYILGNSFGTYGTYVTAFTLPVGYRPPRSVGFSAVANTTAIMTISISDVGVVSVWGSASNGAWLSFANVVCSLT